ncbi:hypothetical protein Mucpa_0121 [Mucilaginibacter paludis DSM 18603]|uniref:Uncharacterized protein n=1 Tax=Mucilaginibacter paludis DSM 18603 TaxID=714943 RepID=H1YDY4_9SPHI|nr:hypothetical protein Mucpa_0121 [Mucilaginibacter paludis DSM 18603]
MKIKYLQIKIDECVKILHGMQEVIGSTPIFSTLKKRHLQDIVIAFFYARAHDLHT